MFSVNDVNNVKVELSAKTTLYACAVYVMRGKPDVGNFPAYGSPGLVTPGLSRRRAYRRAYVASPRLTTTDVGLTPRLAYARIVHMAPGENPSSEIFYMLMTQQQQQQRPFNGL